VSWRRIGGAPERFSDRPLPRRRPGRRPTRRRTPRRRPFATYPLKGAAWPRRFQVAEVVSVRFGRSSRSLQPSIGGSRASDRAVNPGKRRESDRWQKQLSRSPYSQPAAREFLDVSTGGERLPPRAAFRLRTSSSQGSVSPSRSRGFLASPAPSGSLLSPPQALQDLGSCPLPTTSTARSLTELRAPDGIRSSARARLEPAARVEGSMPTRRPLEFGSPCCRPRTTSQNDGDVEQRRRHRPVDLPERTRRLTCDPPCGVSLHSMRARGKIECASAV
jgi:hypothetical protein